jgi:tetratricopeptide (TPR) repeat protein
MSSSAIRSDRLLCAVFAMLVIALPAHAQRPGQGDDESASLVDEGRAALRAGKLDDAAAALDQAIALNPRRVEAYVLRSAVHAARKEYKQGIALMKRAQQLSPTDEEVLTALGSQLVLSGDVTAGVPLLVQVTGKNPARYDAQVLLGHHFHAAGKWTEAIAALEAYFTHRPPALAKEDPRHRIDLADAYLRARQPAKARDLFAKALAEKGPRGDLRAQMGVAWATAAIDCKQARLLLEKLASVAEQYPEVWLVDGQCALVLGDVFGALAFGRKYLERKNTAAGHALVGEAQAARANFAEARRSFETARKLEPARRRWPLRLAIVLRRGADPGGALAVLEELGPPATAASDPAWWIELGETLLARGEPKTAVTRLSPVVSELPGNAPIRVVLGAAQLASREPELAIKTLTEAESIASTSRGKKLLVTALGQVATGKLASDPAAAEAMLAKADALEGNPVVWRNLGIARLALDRPADAVAVLDRAAKADPTPTTLMLAARARALTGDTAGARPLYERALASGDRAVDVAIDWAASEVAGGDPALGVTALEKTAAQAKGNARHKTALAIARHAAGVAALRAGNGKRAVDLLELSVKDEPTLAARCDLALAAVVAGEVGAAMSALRAITGKTCPFPPPADTQAAPILIGFTEGLNARSPQRRTKALDRLTKLVGKSSGTAAVLLNTSLRVIALEAARDAVNEGRVTLVRKFLQVARKANARVGADDVAHGFAVLELLEGRTDSAIALLDKIAPKVPEALVHLGIAYERKGEPVKALDAWRRARKAGVRFAPLADWIESKERIYGGAP